MHAIVAEKNVEEQTRHVLSEIFVGCSLDKVGVRLWDGTVWPDEGPRPAMLALKHSGALGRMFLPGTEVGLAEAYLHDDFDIEGDTAVAFEIGDFLLAHLGDWRNKLKLAGLLVALPDRDGRSTMRRAARQLPPRIRGKRHSLERDRRAVTFHYDVSNNFYKLWLDRRMVYSCAYFHSADDSLDVAQEAKLDLICRKLRFKPGDRLLDIGCGWGGLIMYAAERYGVDATGITLSENQASLARERIDQAGLGERCRVAIRDYRTLTADDGYDKIASVGMIEHVGLSHLPVYFASAFRALKAGGLFLNHGIVSLREARPKSRS